MLRILPFATLLLFLGFITSCDEDDQFPTEDLSTVPEAPDTTGVEREVLDSGIIIYIHEEGEGDNHAAEEDIVDVRYALRTNIYTTDDQTIDGDIQESSWSNGREDPMQLNLRERSQGLRLGMQGMREGGERTLIIPSDYAYQATGDDDIHYHIILDEIMD